MKKLVATFFSVALLASLGAGALAEDAEAGTCYSYWGGKVIAYECPDW